MSEEKAVQEAVELALARRDVQELRAEHAATGKRLATLEREFSTARSEVVTLKRRLDELEGRTLLLDKSQMTRAFAVWGLSFLAQVVISLALFAVGFIVLVIATGGRFPGGN